MGRVETKITKDILSYLRGLGMYAFKVHVDEYTVPGTPDILACFGGEFLAVEVKQPGEVPSPRQLYEMRKITESGGVALVVTSLAELQDKLGEFEWIGTNARELR